MPEPSNPSSSPSNHSPDLKSLEEINRHPANQLAKQHLTNPTHALPYSLELLREVLDDEELPPETEDLRERLLEYLNQLDNQPPLEAQAGLLSAQAMQEAMKGGQSKAAAVTSQLDSLTLQLQQAKGKRKAGMAGAGKLLRRLQETKESWNPNPMEEPTLALPRYSKTTTLP